MVDFVGSHNEINRCYGFIPWRQYCNARLSPFQTISYKHKELILINVWEIQGLVLPPTVASIQVVIVPIFKSGAENDILLNKVNEIKQELKAAGIRVHVDVRDNYTSGWKFNDWEMKGVPLRFEIGHRDIENS